MDRISSPFPLDDNEHVQAQLANAPPFQLLETMLYTPDKGMPEAATVAHTLLSSVSMNRLLYVRRHCVSRETSRPALRDGSLLRRRSL